MIVYHGTVDKYLPAIQSEGLKPTPKNGFYGALGFFMVRIAPSKTAVYFSPKRDTAVAFAEMKANYLAATYGTFVSDSDDKFAIIKTLRRVITDAKPALVTLDLPKTFAVRIDQDTATNAGYLYKGSIPPEYIKSVEVLHDSAF